MVVSTPGAVHSHFRSLPNHCLSSSIDSTSSSSKSAKKNAKRRAKKATAPVHAESSIADNPPPVVTIATKEEEPRVKSKPSKPVDPIAKLKQQIEDAKASKVSDK